VSHWRTFAATSPLALRRPEQKALGRIENGYFASHPAFVLQNLSKNT